MHLGPPDADVDVRSLHHLERPSRATGRRAARSSPEGQRIGSGRSSAMMALIESASSRHARFRAWAPSDSYRDHLRVHGRTL